MTVYVVTLTDFEDGITYVRGVYSNMKKAEEVKRELDTWQMSKASRSNKEEL